MRQTQFCEQSTKRRSTDAVSMSRPFSNALGPEEAIPIRHDRYCSGVAPFPAFRCVDSRPFFRRRVACYYCDAAPRSFCPTNSPSRSIGPDPTIERLQVESRDWFRIGTVSVNTNASTTTTRKAIAKGLWAIALLCAIGRENQIDGTRSRFGNGVPLIV